MKQVNSSVGLVSAKEIHNPNKTLDDYHFDDAGDSAKIQGPWGRLY